MNVVEWIANASMHRIVVNWVCMSGIYCTDANDILLSHLIHVPGLCEPLFVALRSCPNMMFVDCLFADKNDQSCPLQSIPLFGRLASKKKPSGYCNYVASCVSSHLYTYTKSLQHTLLWVTWSSCMIHWLFIHTNTTQAVSYRYKFKVLWSVKLTSLSLAHILAFLKIDSPPILTLMMKNDFIAIFWFIISFNIILYYIII